MAWRNRFLDSLDEDDLKPLRSQLTAVNLARGQKLDETGHPIGAVYFPMDAILSVVTVMGDGSQVESRTIGRETGYGLMNVLGSPLSQERMEVQVGGRAWRAGVPAMRAAAGSSASLAHAIALHSQAAMLLACRTVACNTLHPAEQRLCRWLLLTQDRLDSDILPLTQEHLSIMLGVQRTTVTAVASQLQARKFISYVRGKICILDRAAIEAVACECYAEGERGVAALLGPLH